MKSFIGLLLTFTTIICVNADLAADQQAFISKTTGEYIKLNELEIKSHIKLAVSGIEALMNEAAAQYRKEDLGLVADNYVEIEKWVNQGIDNMFLTLAKEELKDRMTNLIKLGVTVETIKWRGEIEKKSRAANPLKVSDTEANLEKKFQEISDKALTLTKWTVEELTKKKSLFWADVHQKVYDFLNELKPSIETRFKALKTDEIKAKNLQVMINDVTLLLAVADTRPPATFFEKVTEKFYDITTKVKSTFKNLYSKLF